ncbi:uncharacterized protein LOC100902821 [Galendromus occidentalis]|uniref:Uncharacterized protein LOC100902821 n=1 Tax=Galendromus occidentalis TaxID=34638 RepID=A0AAJ7L6R5_9ACAR|nr:uncharacterized protein LOC100902821 [Galendromus occidentalis]
MFRGDWWKLPEGRRHVYTKEEQQKAEKLLDMIFGDYQDLDEDDGFVSIRQRTDSVSSTGSIETISSLNYPSSNSVASRQLEMTLASLSPAGSDSPPSSRISIDRTALSKIRNQLSSCLEKMRDLELQLKDVPVLQVKLSVLKEEKRLLKLQLRAKNRGDDSAVTGSPSISSILDITSAGESHTGDETLNQLRIPSLLQIKTLTPPREPPRVPPIHSEESIPRLAPLRSSSPTLSRGRRSAADNESSAILLKDELWDEATGQPRYKTEGDSSQDIADYLKDASVNEPLIIPKFYNHTGINCCAETRDRGTHTDMVHTRHAGVGSSSPLPPPLREVSEKKHLCDQCNESLLRPKRYPRTSATQTTPEKAKDCSDCSERRKRSLRSTSVNTDSEEPPKKTPKETFTFDVLDGTSILPKPCEECEKRKLTRSYSVSTSTVPSSTRNQSTDPMAESPSMSRKTAPSPPPKPKNFTRSVGVQSSYAVTISQSVQVNPELVRTRDSSCQSDSRLSQRQVGTQSERLQTNTNSVASGDFDVRHSVCDSCSSKRLRSVGTGEITIYDECCNRCGVKNKRDGGVQCNILTESNVQSSKEPLETCDKYVLTDDPYCEDITEGAIEKLGVLIFRASVRLVTYFLLIPPCLTLNCFHFVLKLIAIPCERCDVERIDCGMGDEDVFAEKETPRKATEEVGVMTDHSIIEPLCFPPQASGTSAGAALSRTSSASSVSHITGAVRLCDKCNCAIESVAKDFIDKNEHDPIVPSLQSRIPKLNQRGPRAPPRRAKPAAFDSVTKSLRRDVSVDDQQILAQNQSLPEPAERTGGKHTLSRDMDIACNILNEYLQRPENSDPNKLKSALQTIQTEWFKVTNRVDIDPYQIQDYLEEFDKMSNHLLHRIVNMADNNGNTALHYAVSHGNFSVVTRLLDSKVTDVNKQNKAGYTPVMLVALADVDNDSHKVTVQRLFATGDVNSKASQNGQTALMLAASHGKGEMVKMLLDADADPNTQDNDGSTALMCAAEHGYIDVVRILLANPDVEINIADNDGQTALSIAMEAGHKDTALLIYASSNFSRGNSPYSSLRGRKSRISPRATPPPSRPSRTPPPSRPSRTPPPPSPSRSRKGSTSSVSSFSRAWF